MIIRPATLSDAQPILAILTGIAAEGAFTAISEPWPLNQQQRYLAGLSRREVVHVAEAEGAIVGYQSLDVWAPTLASMAHVGQLGTFLMPEWRGRGVAAELFKATLQFAQQSACRKFVIQVRATNTRAQTFYRRLGFMQCGRFKAQVRIGNEEDDEILMDVFVEELRRAAANKRFILRSTYHAIIWSLWPCSTFSAVRRIV
ncbi:MAG: N-acetyltransferase [Acidobacteriota bacterium]